LTWTIHYPATGLIFGPKLKSRLRASRLTGFVIGSTGASIGIYHTSDVSSAGISMTTGANMINQVPIDVTSFDNGDSVADEWIYLKINAVYGSPTYACVTLCVGDY